MTTVPKRIALLGSTGSVGRQTLDVVRHFPESFRVVALAARSNVALLAEQAQEFQPLVVACTCDTAESQREVRTVLPNAILGEEGLLAAATHPEVDIVVTATSGLMGLHPTLAAIHAGKTIALANKETLVMAGHIVMEVARQAGVAIYPIDSEHSALWQCLRGETAQAVRKLIITASGGPFRLSTLSQMHTVSVEQALAHPTWQMGPKITIDSATLMNKGLEVIEAHWLFDIPYEQIEVVVHPESIVHSMVEFVDGSIKMQASLPSMHLPIMNALSYPGRLDETGSGFIRELHWSNVARLNFEALDVEKFACFRLAIEAARRAGSYPSVLVGADEEAVALFLAGKIALTEIADLIEHTLERHQPIENPTVEQTLEACAWARHTTNKLYQRNRNTM